MMERKPRRTDALVALDPTKTVTYHGDREEYHVGGVLVTDFTECDKKLKELEAQWETEQYQRDRASDYPSWQDQMDMLYHKGVAGWKAEIKKVKDANPKPSE